MGVKQTFWGLLKKKRSPSTEWIRTGWWAGTELRPTDLYGLQHLSAYRSHVRLMNVSETCLNPEDETSLVWPLHQPIEEACFKDIDLNSISIF